MSSPRLVVLEAILTSSMLLAVLMRLFVRARITKVWGWDDYTCVIAACGSLAHMIDFTQMSGVGSERRLGNIRAATLLDAHDSRVPLAANIIFALTIFFAKLSIMLLYLRIFTVDRRMRLFIYLGISFQALYYSAMIGVGIGAVVECNGHSQLTHQLCANFRAVVVLNVTINAVTDIYVLLLPVPCVLKLQLSRRHRLGLLLVFASGVVTCIVSLVRLINVCVHYNDRGILWVQASTAQGTIFEINLAIIVACATCFPAFFAKIREFSTSIPSFLRSRIVTITNRSETTIQIGSGHQAAVIKKASAHSDRWYGDEAKLKHDCYFELHDINDFGGATVVHANFRTGSPATDQHGMVNDQLSIVRTTQYDVDFRSRVLEDPWS